MSEAVILLGFALPPLLLVGGLLSLGLAMPSARDTLERWGWLTPWTIVLLGLGTFVLLELIRFRGDGDTSIWADSDGGGRIATGAAVLLAVAAVAVQGWVVARRSGPVSGRVLSAGMWLTGAAMLALFAAVILAWLVEVG